MALRRDASTANLDRVVAMLGETRPTAINLRWALARMRAALHNMAPAARIAGAYAEAAAICDDDVETCRRIGEHGLPLLRDIALRKAAVSGAEEPLVIAYAFEATRALLSGSKQKEIDKVMQGPAADAIPGVIQGANAVLELMLLSVVRLITKDNYDRTAYALRTNCPVAWLDPESKIPIGEDGKLAPTKKK